MKALLAAFQFLTIIPIRIKGEVSARQIAGSAAFFPLVGLLQGVLAAAACQLSLKFFSPAVTAVILIFAYLATNGAFHMDGLSDTFDALSVKSTGQPEKDKEKRLSVMKDSTSGPIGVTAIVLSLLFKYVLIREIVEIPAYSVLLIMPVVSAWSMTMIIPGARSARPDGLGKMFFEGVNRVHALLATTLTIAVSAAIYFLIAGPAYGDARCFGTFFLIAAALSLLTGTLIRGLCSARFGGLTGDNLGAIREMSDIVILLAAVLWL